MEKPLIDQMFCAGVFD